MNFIAKRLTRMREVLDGYVLRGELPGLVALLWRKGEVRVDAIGALSFGGDLIQRDSIFRISSMTKPITAVAAMILVEECKLRLDEPVLTLLPELANRRVLRTPDSPIGDTVPAQRPITLRDLLTHTFGFGQIFPPPAAALRARELAVDFMGPPRLQEMPEPDEWMRRLGTLPLLRQPGEQWIYNTASDVLGVLIARASGQSLPDFLRQRIFEPLAMKDTAFHVPPEKQSRVVASYGMALEPFDADVSKPPAFPSAAAGLVSTADDLLAFGRMLLGGGGEILSRASVQLMTSDQLTPAQKRWGFLPDWWRNRGWGFGRAVATGRDDLSSTPGRYGWDGGFGTSWANDPANDLCGILLTQRMAFPQLSPVYLDFWTTAYASLA
jgi:CubicO group peptidase (beta-lactamase class C family)